MALPTSYEISNMIGMRERWTLKIRTSGTSQLYEYMFGLIASTCLVAESDAGNFSNIGVPSSNDAIVLAFSPCGVQ